MEVIALDFPYGPQDPSYCLISLSNNHERIVSFVTICGTIDGNQTTMTLRSIPSQDVESAYLVVQHAVGELFGGEMQAELVYEAASCLNIAFSLEFVAQMEYKNYDDYSSTLPFQLPSKYNFIWPKLLDITQIIDSIKRGMSTVIGTHGSLVLFEHLNFVLVFSLNIQNIPLDQKAVIHEISTEYLLSVDITSSVNSSPQIRISPLLLTYMSEPMNIIQSSLFNMSSAHSYHSIAITGRHGAGKTTLLNWLDNECYKLHYRCIRIDARQLQVISRDMEMELLSLVHALSLHASNHSNSVVHLIIRALFVLSTLSYTKHNGNTHQDILLSELSLINESTVLAIDNADCLADDEEGKLLISLLQHLMQIISNTYTTTQLSYNLLIILTSSTPLILLPYAERTCELGRPSLQDRHQLIHSFLELFDVEREDNSIDWSDSISRLTSGYLPGDIRQIIDRSRALSAGSVVIWADVLNAVATVVPEQMKGISRLLHSSGCSSTSLCWADYAGYDTVKKRVFHVLSQLQLTSHTSQHSKRDNNNKLSMCMNNQNGGIVLHGLSGNGKTFLASIIASEIRVNFLHVRCTELLSKYYGETEANIRSVFKSAVAPCLLFLDEFDVFAHKRSDTDESNGLNSRILSTFLNELDGTTAREASEGGVTVMVACKSLLDLDDALLRPGRLSHHIHIHPPRKTDIVSILHRKLINLPTSNELEVESIADVLCKLQPTCADIDLMCKDAVMSAVRSVIYAQSAQAEEQAEGGHTQVLLTRAHFDDAIRARYGDVTLFTTSFSFNVGV